MQGRQTWWLHLANVKNDPLESLHPLTQKLLEWYRNHARELPWRTAPEPYATWLSEVILQQTRVDQGTAYWHRFMAAFPTVQDLASAETEAVMGLWKGLGYYSRARNLHEAAKRIVRERGGQLPETAADWASLPGIGPYTAAAIASICHGEPVPVIDGNVQRVVSRLFDIPDPVDRKAGRTAIEAACSDLISTVSPGDSNQAWMELGALVCAPRNPDCAACPLSDGCMSRQRGTMLQRPVKQPKKPPLEVDVLFEIPLRKAQDGRLEWWVETRPPEGIWSQLEAFPCTITPRKDQDPTSTSYANEAFGPVPHILTHRRMTARFIAVDAAPPSEDHGRWVEVEMGQANWPRIIDKILPELRTWIVKN